MTGSKNMLALFGLDSPVSPPMTSALTYHHIYRKPLAPNDQPLIYFSVMLTAATLALPRLQDETSPRHFMALWRRHWAMQKSAGYDSNSRHQQRRHAFHFPVQRLHQYVSANSSQNTTISRSHCMDINRAIARRQNVSACCLASCRISSLTHK